MQRPTTQSWHPRPAPQSRAWHANVCTRVGPCRQHRAAAWRSPPRNGAVGLATEGTLSRSFPPMPARGRECAGRCGGGCLWGEYREKERVLKFHYIKLSPALSPVPTGRKPAWMLGFAFCPRCPRCPRCFLPVFQKMDPRGDACTGRKTGPIQPFLARSTQ